MNALLKKKNKYRMCSKLLALGSSLWIYLVRKDFTLMESSPKLKIQNASNKNVGFLFFIEKLGDLEALVSLSALIQSLIQPYLLRLYYVPGTFLGIQKNERTKSGKNQLKISAATSVYKCIIFSVLP